MKRHSRKLSRDTRRIKRKITRRHRSKHKGGYVYGTMSHPTLKSPLKSGIKIIYIHAKFFLRYQK